VPLESIGVVEFGTRNPRRTNVPSTHAIAMLAVTVIVFYLYTRPWIRMEYVSL